MKMRSRPIISIEKRPVFKLIFSILLLTSSVELLAQERYFYFNLDINKPLSNTSWVGETSARGFRAGYRFFINDKFSAGLDISNAVYDQYKPTETTETGSGAITTDYFKYVYSYSAAASAQYNFRFGESETFYPYVGLGLGANNNEYTLYYNIYKDSETKWGFLARPEAGVLVKFGQRRSLGAMAAVHYDYSTNKSENFDYNNFSSVGFQVGIILMNW